MLRRAARFGLACVLIAAVFLVCALISALLWDRWGAELRADHIGGATFFLPWLIVLAFALRSWPELRPPWRIAGRPLDLVTLAGVLAVVAYLYRFQLGKLADAHAPPLTFAVLSATLFGVLVEEWLFRHVLWREIAGDAQRPHPVAALVAIAATSIAFAVWHLPYNFEAPLVLHAAFGALMGLLRWRFASVTPGLVIHVAANTLYFVVN